MGKNKGNKEAAAAAAAAPKAPQEISAEPGFFGHVLKPGQSLIWENETEELALQLTTAALGPKVTPGRSTLIAEAKDTKIALCTLIPEKTEQWNMTHIFTPFDGPVLFHNEGVNEIHLTGLIDIQDDEDDEEGGHHDHDGCEDHDHDDDSDDDEGMPMDGTYSDSDDDEVMVFGGGDDDDSEDDASEEDDEEDEGRFEVLEERVHGEAGEKKQKKETPKKKDAAPAKKEEKKETPKKETTPAKKEQEAAPAKKDEKKEAATPAKKDAEAANSKKRPASSDAVEVPKKAKTTTRVHKGVTIEEVAIGKGQPVGRGKKVSILYRGRLLNGKQFDANQNRKSPFSFRHGVGDVIKGMDIGIEGMRAGGKRTITIPSHLGYGKSGAGASIPGNSTLIFEIEML